MLRQAASENQTFPALQKLAQDALQLARDLVP